MKLIRVLCQFSQISGPFFICFGLTGCDEVTRSGIAQDIEAPITSTQQVLQAKRNAVFLAEVERVRKKAEEDPKDASAQFMLGLAYFKVGEVGKAQTAMSEAIHLDPKFQRAYVYRAILRAATARVIKESGLGSEIEIAEWRRKALQDWREAIQLFPNDVFALNERAAHYVSLDQYEEALSDLNKILSIDELNESALRSRSVIYLSQGKLDEALGDIETAILFNSHIPILYGIEGDIFQKMGKHELAIEAYDSATLRAPTLWTVYERRAESLEQLGRTNEAKQSRASAEELKNILGKSKATSGRPGQMPKD